MALIKQSSIILQITELVNIFAIYSKSLTAHKVKFNLYNVQKCNSKR